MPEMEGTDDPRGEVGATCARKGAERGFTGRSWCNMCLKRSGKRIHGEKLVQHVPEKKRTDDSRGEDAGTCARNGADGGFTGRRCGNMDP
ncbi:hypothetical protein J7E38_22560 [Bacillus sp. ISL-35]|uniref:hypothetical protein n=1 Tax=Bacillus sp. ISL-35 TaxID=2819122 RepID=UPI001BE89660|nr:hypothetical protein [Bacillus sp. ISL-35]MBT2681744.1 hypothetical protein [Bacillus sp. ISL-35]MBT2706041.1 hypothetical protein [Chryseobacterium sp. ISL-80]